MSMEPKELYPGIYYLEKEIPNQTVKEPGYYWYNKKTFPTGIYIVRDRGEGRMISFGSYGVTVYPGKTRTEKMSKEGTCWPQTSNQLSQSSIRQNLSSRLCPTRKSTAHTSKNSCLINGKILVTCTDHLP